MTHALLVFGVGAGILIGAMIGFFWVLGVLMMKGWAWAIGGIAGFIGGAYYLGLQVLR